MGASLLKKTCLKPNDSLRRQLLQSFGLSALFTLSVVVVLSCVAVYRAGELVKDRAGQVMRQQVHVSVLDTTRSVAESFSKYRETLEGVAELMSEIVADRIVGYPEEGWEDDVYVPFFDSDSQRNVYPLNTPPVPLDWNITLSDIPSSDAAKEKNKELAREIAQERYIWAEATQHYISPFNASWFIQGLCNPLSSVDQDPSLPATYYPNCTDANNDVNTGGVVHPTATAKGLYEKSGDISNFFRPLYESHPDVMSMAVYFYNQGAGASIHYPGVVQMSSSEPYVSAGCEWMREINTQTGKPFGTVSEVSKCHTNGTRVPSREYNPLERDFYGQFALAQGRITWFGPYRTAVGGLLFMSVGRSILDRRTGNLIGVVSIDIALTNVNRQLEDSLLFDGSDIGIVKVSDGSIVSDTLTTTGTDAAAAPSVSQQAGDSYFSSDFQARWDVRFGLLAHADFDTLNRSIMSLFDGSGTNWTADSVHESIASTLVICEEHIVVGYPLPLPPENYAADYKPDLLVIHSISAEIFSPIEELHQSVNEDVVFWSLVTLSLGLIGLTAILVIVWCVSRMLTQPLLWMESVSWRIVNHTHERVSGDALRLADDDNLTATVKCSPNTEITQLVAEFRTMIQGFSGEGASSVAESELNEFYNELTWQSEFRQLYTRGSEKRQSFRCSAVSGSTPVTEETSTNASDIDKNNNQLQKQAMWGLETELDRQKSAGTSSSNATTDLPRQKSAGTSSSNTTTDTKGNASILQQQKQQKQLQLSNVIFPAPPKQHYGPNIVLAPRAETQQKLGLDKGIRICQSKLFRWIVVLIVIPLILANCAICLVVTFKILNVVPQWVDQLALQSSELSTKALSSLAKSKANLVELTLIPPIRDIHLMARMYGWLSFDAIPRSRSFTTEEQITEECKYYELDACPVLETDRAPCLCRWKDEPVTGTCQVRNSSVARSLQNRMYACQALDYDNITGSRLNITSHPQSAIETRWFTNVSEMPGAYKGADAAGYETMYDRVRVASSFAVVDFPLYNYQTASSRPRYQLSTNMAYEADGMISGYFGCSYGFSQASLFPSNNYTRAFEINPTLCPYGRYGYDPRCRDWYAATRKLYYDSDKSETMHITAPYSYAVSETVGLSIASAIADPQTDEFVGEALIDFVPFGLQKSLARLKEPLSILITPKKDEYDGDTVVGPDKAAKWQSSSIAKLLFEHDTEDSSERAFFETEVLPRMKSGEQGLSTFYRSREDGSKEELTMAFEPVSGRFLAPLDPTDVSRGVNYTLRNVYCFGIALEAGALQAPFEQAKNDVYADLNRLAAIDIAVVLFFSILFTVFTCRISIHVTRPMIVLLRVVQNINSGEIENDIPPLDGGSRELYQVYNSFSKLYKVMRISNTAFFSGNLNWAYHFLCDALMLFRKMGDEKAIGIACNNIGNCLQQMSVQGSKQPGGEACTTSGGQQTDALVYYDEAIEIGQREFDQATDTGYKADFAQRLADRLFNRSLYLLHIQNDENAPKSARELALVDFTKARNLDDDVRDFWLEKHLLLRHSEEVFSRLIRRIHGLSDHYNDEELRSIWDAKEMVEQADRFLFAAWNEPTAPLFDSVNRVGRLQQLETAAVQLELNMGNSMEAGRLAMRMFAEDEQLLESAFTGSANALLRLVREHDPWTPMTVSSMRSDFRRMLRSCRGRGGGASTLDMGKCMIFAIELNETWEGGPQLRQINENCLRLLDEKCDDQDHVGVVAYTVRGDQTLELRSKEDPQNQERQRAMLDEATTSTSESVASALPWAFQMVVDSGASADKDSYVLLVTDGFSWDSESYMSIKWQIERMNRERYTMIHIIVLGLDIEDEEVVEQCKALCTVSKASYYMDITDCVDASDMDAVFATVGALISGQKTKCLRSITMERLASRKYE